MVNAFSFNQRTSEDGPEFRGSFTWPKPININTAWQIKQFVVRESASAKRFGSFFRKDNDQISQFVLFNETLPVEQQFRFPVLQWGWRQRRIHRRRPRFAGRPVPMP